MLFCTLVVDKIYIEIYEQIEFFLFDLLRLNTSECAYNHFVSPIVRLSNARNVLPLHTLMNPTNNRFLEPIEVHVNAP